MSTPSREKISLSAFEAFVNRPENDARRFELIDGEIVEVPSNPFVSHIAFKILYLLQRYLDARGMADAITMEGGGYIVAGHVLAPDGALNRNVPTSQGFETSLPILALEVLSNPKSSQEQSDLRRKLAIYRQVGMMVWVVDYLSRRLEVHTGDEVRIYDATMTLQMGADDLLPGFEMPIAQVLPAEYAETPPDENDANDE